MPCREVLTSLCSVCSLSLKRQSGSRRHCVHCALTLLCCWLWRARGMGCWRMTHGADHVRIVDVRDDADMVLWRAHDLHRYRWCTCGRCLCHRKRRSGCSGHRGCHPHTVCEHGCRTYQPSPVVIACVLVLPMASGFTVLRLQTVHEAPAESSNGTARCWVYTRATVN